MNDPALTAYLFGLAVACPLGLAACQCPLWELHHASLADLRDYLADLPRQRKLDLAGRHLACSDHLYGGLHPADRTRP